MVMELVMGTVRRCYAVRVCLLYAAVARGAAAGAGNRFLSGVGPRPPGRGPSRIEWLSII